MSKVAEIEKELVDSQDKITVLKVQLESSSNLNQTQASPPVKILSKMSLSNSRVNNALPLNTTEARIQTGFYFMFSLMNFLKIMVKSLFILLWFHFCCMKWLHLKEVLKSRFLSSISLQSILNFQRRLNNHCLTFTIEGKIEGKKNLGHSFKM